jgi:hypothetical protein
MKPTRWQRIRCYLTRGHSMHYLGRWTSTCTHCHHTHYQPPTWP